MRVDVSPSRVQAVNCTAENERGSYTLPTVPMHLQVERARGPLTVRCTSQDGWRGAVTVPASVDITTIPGNAAGGAGLTGVAIAGAAAGGTAAGAGAGVAIIGIGRDARNGALWGYPSSLVVPMSPPAETNTVRSATGAALSVVPPRATQPAPRRSAPAARARSTADDPSK